MFILIISNNIIFQKILWVLFIFNIMSGNLILLNAESGYDAVRRRAEVLYSIREGRVIAKTVPSKSYINMKEEKEINFKK